MTNFAISSRVYGANARRTPSFGDNIAGFLVEATPVTATGPQQGDRWIPCTAETDWTVEDVFVSKNVLRKRVSEARERLVRIAVGEWVRGDHGKRKEYHEDKDKYGEDYSAIVGEYWKNIGYDLNGNDRGWPWSAAFISWCVEKAGGYDDFLLAAAHARYVHQAVNRRENETNGSFWGFRLNEHKPEVGDIVCMARGDFSVNYDHAKERDRYESHCDIIIAVREDHVSTIGGNISHNVDRKTFRTNSGGFLRPEKRLYAIMRNNL